MAYLHCTTTKTIVITLFSVWLGSQHKCFCFQTLVASSQRTCLVDKKQTRRSRNIDKDSETMNKPLDQSWLPSYMELCISWINILFWKSKIGLY